MIRDSFLRKPVQFNSPHSLFGVMASGISGHLGADDYASMYESRSALTTVQKQHFVEWFSGSALDSIWTTTLTGATTITTQDVVDGGLGITTGASSGNGGMIDFNNKRQYAHDGSVLIGVIQRNDNLWSQFGLTANTGAFSTDWAGVQDFSSQTWVQVRSADSTGTNIDTDIAVNENASSVKIELSSSNIVVHIDGVLKVTKTTNRPRVNMQPGYRVFSETTSASKTGYIRYLEAYNT